MQRYQGTIKSWLDDKGFGFIEFSGDKRDVFIHIRDFKHAGYTPKIGDFVSYQLVEQDGKLRAYEALVNGQEISAKHPAKTFRKQRPTVIKQTQPIKKDFPWFLLILLIAIPFACSLWLIKQQLNIFPLFTYLLISLITFIVYAIDKTKAHKNQWRIPEANLHLLELLGGWPGALIAQRIMRHKNKKESYQSMFWFIVILHIAAWCLFFSTTPSVFFDKIHFISNALRD